MKRNLFEMDETEKSRILEMHQTATSKQYLTEQSNSDIVNITITDLIKQPKPVRVNISNAKTIAFPTVTGENGEPLKGNIGVKNMESVIGKIGNYYLLIGKVGVLDDKLNVQNTKLGAQLFTIPIAETSAGKPVRSMTNLLNPTNGPFLISTICKAIDSSKPYDVFTQNKQNFIDLYKLSEELGVSPLKLDTLDNDVKKQMTA